VESDGGDSGAAPVGAEGGDEVTNDTTNGTKKNPAAVALGRRGGSVRSEAKRAAARANAARYWERVRSGEIVRQAKTNAKT